MEGKTALLLEMSQWNSNDLVEQIETLGHLEHSRGKTTTVSPTCFLYHEHIFIL